MKKNILSIFCCLSLLALASCSDDYNDASTKHVYGENEDPYLKVDEDAQITWTKTFKINIASSATQTVVNLEGYAEQFETQLGMSVDGVLSGLEDGSVVFYPINASRNKWTKTAYTKDDSGWYFNSANQPCAADDADRKATVTLDKTAKSLIAAVTPEAGGGTSLQLNVGFAKNGPDFDDYVRFTFNLSVDDPTYIYMDYTFSYDGAYTIELPEDYASNIEDVFGMSFSEFNDALNAGEIQFALADPATQEWINRGTPATTYYTNLAGQATQADADDFAVSAAYEMNSNGVESLIFKYNNTLAEGTTGQICVGFVDKNDEGKAMKFMISYYIGALGK